MKTTTSPTETYRAAKTASGSSADACRAVMAAHGLTFDQAVELSWHIETGKPEPKWLHEDGAQTSECRAWERGAARRDAGE